MREKFYYYNYNIITHKKLSKEEQGKIWDGIIKVINKKLATGGSRQITKVKWEKIMDVLNNG